MFRILLGAAVLGVFPACMAPQSAARLAGVTEPGFWMRTPSGWEVRATADTRGKTHYEIDPATGKVSFDLDMASDAAGVTRSQGERAEALTELVKLDAARAVAQQQAFNDLVARVLAVALPGPAVPK